MRKGILILFSSMGLLLHVVAQANKFPNQVMITVHPQRWTDNLYLWAKELLLQNTKNVVKFVLNKIR